MMNDVTVQGVRILAEVFYTHGSIQIRVTEAGEFFLVYLMEGLIVCQVQL